MQAIDLATLADWADASEAGWSVGAFGAVGEFSRDPDETADLRREAHRLEVVTARGALRLCTRGAAAAVAWDSLSADGETWSHALAVCTPRATGSGSGGLREIGPDHEAVRLEDRDDTLFDLGVCPGVVRMAVRTCDPGLLSTLRAAQGRPLLEAPDVATAVLRVQPHRVLLSPIARIEVYQPIPPPEGKSPVGPHTHLLPKLIARGRAHSANTPIPDGWQAALTLHPPSPWRTSLGARRPFDAVADGAFAPLLERHQCEEDRHAVAQLAAAVERADTPDEGLWPVSRRGRAKARVWLRRRHAAGDPRVGAWRARFDRLEAAVDEAVDEEPE